MKQWTEKDLLDLQEKVFTLHLLVVKLADGNWTCLLPKLWADWISGRLQEACASSQLLCDETHHLADWIEQQRFRRPTAAVAVAAAKGGR